MSNFSQLQAQLSARPGVTNPAALAASIGDRKFGKAGMARKAAAGRKKHTVMDLDRQLAGK